MTVFLKIKKKFGEKRFNKLRLWFYKYLHKIYPSFTKESFKNFLINEIGLSEGDTLFIHSSVYKLNISFPSDQVIKVLQEIVGEKGTIAFPCWHFNLRAEDYLQDPNNVFDVKKSPTVMGLLPELARRNKGAYRSLHPTSSVVALGKNAYDLVKDHHLSEFPCDSFSPFYRILHYHGKVVGLGEKPENSLSFVHCPEDELIGRFPIKTRTDKVYNGRVIDLNGQEIFVKTRAAHQNIQNRDMKGFFKKFIQPSECRVIRKNATWFYAADSVMLYKKLEDLALRGKTIYRY